MPKSEEEQEIESLSSQFEAVQISMTKDRTGFILKLSVNREDAPEDLLRDPVGQRYLIVAVRLNDQDEPVAGKAQEEGNFAVKTAAMLCADSRFQEWLAQQGLIDDLSEQSAAEFVRDHCKIASRSELKHSPDARKRFLALRAEFADHLRRA
jgi:hypothetical protein